MARSEHFASLWWQSRRTRSAANPAGLDALVRTNNHKALAVNRQDFRQIALSTWRDRPTRAECPGLRMKIGGKRVGSGLTDRKNLPVALRVPPLTSVKCVSVGTDQIG